MIESLEEIRSKLTIALELVEKFGPPSCWDEQIAKAHLCLYESLVILNTRIHIEAAGRAIEKIRHVLPGDKEVTDSAAAQIRKAIYQLQDCDDLLYEEWMQNL